MLYFSVKTKNNCTTRVVYFFIKIEYILDTLFMESI